MDFATIESLRQILDYLHDDEEKDWLASGAPEDGHIFCDIKRVIKWLDSDA